MDELHHQSSVISRTVLPFPPAFPLSVQLLTLNSYSRPPPCQAVSSSSMSMPCPCSSWLSHIRSSLRASTAPSRISKFRAPWTTSSQSHRSHSATNHGLFMVWSQTSQKKSWRSQRNSHNGETSPAITTHMCPVYPPSSQATPLYVGMEHTHTYVPRCISGSSSEIDRRSRPHLFRRFKNVSPFDVAGWHGPGIPKVRHSTLGSIAPAS